VYTQIAWNEIFPWCPYLEEAGRVEFATTGVASDGKVENGVAAQHVSCIIFRAEKPKWKFWMSTIRVTYGRTFVRTCLLSIAILLLAVSPSRANFIVTGTDQPFAGFTRYFSPPPNTDITGWTISGSSGGNPNNVDLVNNAKYPAFVGTQSLDMEGNVGASGVIFQTFATVPGTVYNLSFAYGNNPYGSGATMNVLVTGAGKLLNQSVSHNTSTLSNMNYQLFSQNFTADSATTTLTFSAITNSGYGIALDAVSVNSASATTTQILPQLAFGGGWYTALYFTNLTTSPVSFPVNFVAGDGTALNIPALNSSAAQVNLESRGTAIIEVPDTGSLVEGYAAAALPSGVTGYGVFRYTAAGAVAGQEAVVPLSGTTATTSTMIFDETSYTTGVAVVGIGSSAVTVNVTAYGTGGNTIGTGSIQLAANGQTALLLRDIPGLSGVVGQRGSVDFSVRGANVAVLGIRYNGLAFTSIPTSDR